MNKLYKAKVIDNDSANADDATQNGRVKIYIEAYHRDISPKLLPWALPAKNGSGGSSTFGVSCIPEINSYVWVFFEDERFHRNAFYIWDLNLNELNPHNLYTDNVSSEVGAVSVYPDVKYIYLKNGICVAISSDESNPEITIYHPSASMFIDKSGNIDIKNANGDEIIMNATGIEIKAPTKVIKMAGTPGAPNGLGGFCAVPNCLFTGAILTTDTITGS